MKIVIFWFRIDICFFQPFLIEGETKQAKGVIIEFGVTDISYKNAFNAVKKSISQDFEKVEYQINVDYCGIIEKEKIQSEIYGDDDISENLVEDPLSVGIWYKTGRLWYT